jgi:hypothetical protein
MFLAEQISNAYLSSFIALLSVVLHLLWDLLQAS